MHLDHLAISRFTSDAIATAADPRWFPELGPAHVVMRLLWTAPVMPWDEGEFAPRPGVDFLVDTSKWWRQRAEALSAHRTQRTTLDKLYLKQANVEHLLSFDVLRQAWGPALDRRPADDVFTGL